MSWITNPYRFGLPPAEATTWGITVVATGDMDRTAISELEFAATSGGANECVGGTGYISAGSGASIPFDGIAGDQNGWTISETAGSINSIWYTKAAIWSVAEIRLHAVNAVIHPPAGLPTAFLLWYSNDNGTTRTNVEWFYTTTATASELKTFAVTTYAPIPATRTYTRLWRFRTSAIQSGGSLFDFSLQEQKFFATNGGANLMTTGRVTTYGTRTFAAGGGSAISSLIDGTSSTWNSGWVNEPKWAGVVLESAVPNPYAFEVTSSGGTGAPKDSQIQWSPDGVTWNTVDTFTGQSAWSTPETRTFTITAA